MCPRPETRHKPRLPVFIGLENMKYSVGHRFTSYLPPLPTILTVMQSVHHRLGDQAGERGLQRINDRLVKY